MWPCVRGVDIVGRQYRVVCRGLMLERATAKGHSICLSICLSICPSVCPFVILVMQVKWFKISKYFFARNDKAMFRMFPVFYCQISKS